MKKIFQFIFLFLSLNLFSQSQICSKLVKNILVNAIAIDEKGINATSENIFDTLSLDVNNNTFLYCYPDSSDSFWHKIYVNTDCEITFNILPSGTDNRYNYFLYQKEQDINIEDVLSKKIEPIRANLFEDKMYITGTGLSVSSCVSVRNSCSNDKTKDFYHTPYHSAVKAKKGDVLLLNIYHVQGSDCGYLFTLNANKYSQKFQSLYKSCYVMQAAKTRPQRSVNLNPSKKLPETVEVKKENIPIISKAAFIVRDSIKHSPIDVEISFVKKQNEMAPLISAIEKGKYEFVLEKNQGYHLAFSAIGYKNMDVIFITTDTLHSFTNEVYLSALKEGDNFVMDKIYFHPNSYYFKSGAQEEIDKLLSYLKTSPGISIEIQGHTNGNKRIKASYKSDFKGSAKKLSQYRADKIKKYLIENGISAERLSAIGYGGSKPIFPEPKSQAQANKNIRVEILILSQKESAVTQSEKTARIKNSR